jgi:hypothetical protein
MRMSRLGIALLLALWAVAPQKTLKFQDPGGVDSVTYPTASFSAGEIKAIIRLSPKLRMGTSYPVFNQLELCDKSDSRYRGCGTEAAQGQWFAANARVNIQEMKSALEDLDKIPKLKGLDQIIDYERPLQRFYFDAGNVMLQFALTGDSSVLEEPIVDINPRTECSDALLKVKNAKSQTEANNLVEYDWYNCMNAKLWKKVGPYPTSAWKLFLDEAGIIETYIPEDDD